MRRQPFSLNSLLAPLSIKIKRKNHYGALWSVVGRGRRRREGAKWREERNEETWVMSFAESHISICSNGKFIKTYEREDREKRQKAIFRFLSILFAVLFLQKNRIWKWSECSAGAADERNGNKSVDSNSQFETWGKKHFPPPVLLFFSALLLTFFFVSFLNSHSSALEFLIRLCLFHHWYSFS